MDFFLSFFASKTYWNFLLLHVSNTWVTSLGWRCTAHAFMWYTSVTSHRSGFYHLSFTSIAWWLINSWLWQRCCCLTAYKSLIHHIIDVPTEAALSQSVMWCICFFLLLSLLLFSIESHYTAICAKACIFFILFNSLNINAHFIFVSYVHTGNSDASSLQMYCECMCMLMDFIATRRKMSILKWGKSVVCLQCATLHLTLVEHTWCVTHWLKYSLSWTVAWVYQACGWTWWNGAAVLKSWKSSTLGYRTVE